MIRAIWSINSGYNSGNLSLLRPVSLNILAFRPCLPLILLAFWNGASAIGLGELRGQPFLGEQLRLEIVILGVDKQLPDPTCFRLVRPEGADDLPWLKKATLSVRRETPPILEIRTDAILREPILQLAVQLGCGHEVSREYMLLASPEKNVSPPLANQHPFRDDVPLRSPRIAPQSMRPSSSMPEGAELPARLAPRRAERRPAPNALPDRVMLSSGIDVGEPALRLATEIVAVSADGAKEAQREMLRLEFRMLMALNEQATSQLATAEKLRRMEDTLGELQQRAAEFSQRVERGTVSVEPSAVPASTPDVPRKQAVAVNAERASELSDWSLYGILFGALLGLGGWLGWRNYREHQQRLVDETPVLPASAIAGGSRQDGGLGDSGSVDLHFDQPVQGMSTPLNLDLDGGDPALAVHPVGQPSPLFAGPDSAMPMGAAMVDEHFEASPVMELADIMLSFGRVKGAAQALQEYIDNNPQEALQPWIRLMDVYRMAGMRDEFERVARNLNQQFNVELQHWDPSQSLLTDQAVAMVAGDSGTHPAAPRAECLEDMPRIMSMVCEMWASGDVVGYLYQLLRDNRGGKRLGFALPVVEEILFLIELKETSNRIG